VQLVRPTLADDGDYRPGLHPEHPAAVEGCRPVSRGLMLELVTGANVIRGYGSCRLANHLQEKACKKKMVAGEGFEPSKAEPGDLQSLTQSSRMVRKPELVGRSCFQIWLGSSHLHSGNACKKHFQQRLQRRSSRRILEIPRPWLLLNRVR
jgi:hypothetical protein